MELFAKPVLGRGATDEKAVATAKAAMESWAEGVERMLEKQDKGFMAGKDFSLVDIYYIPMVKRMEDCEMTEVILGRPKIKEWWERCLERPAVKQWVETAVTRKTVIDLVERMKAAAAAASAPKAHV